MMICGVDPGVSGALAFFDPMNGSLDVEDMPTLTVQLKSGKNRTHVNSVALGRLLADRRPTCLIVEDVFGMSNDGATQAFQFGRAFGAVEGVAGALHIPLHRVRPATWTSRMKAPTGKDGHRARAIELFPNHASAFSRKKDAGRADAALIAMYHFREGGA
jgi:crossover junction endodeoxyribonuclease RuvC